MIALLFAVSLYATVSGTGTAKEVACSANSPIPAYFDDVYRTCLARTVIGSKATGTDAYLNHNYFDEKKRSLLYQCTKNQQGPKLSQTHEMQFEECYAREAGLRLKVSDEKAAAAIAFEQECGVVSELLSEYDCRKESGPVQRVYKFASLQQLKNAYDHCLPQHQRLIEKYFKCPDEADAKSMLFGIFKANPQISAAELKPLNDCFVAKATQQSNFITKSKSQFETTYDVANLISVIRCKVSRMAAGGNAEKTVVARLSWLYSKFKDMFSEYAKWFANSYYKRLDCMLSLIKPELRLKTLFCTDVGKQFIHCVPESDHILIAGAYLDASSIRAKAAQANEAGWVAKDEKHATTINTKSKWRMKIARLRDANPMAVLVLKIIKKAFGWLKSKAGLIFCHKKYGIWGKTEVGDLIKALGGDPTQYPSSRAKRTKRFFGYNYNAKDIGVIIVSFVLFCILYTIYHSVPGVAAFLSHVDGWVVLGIIIAAFFGMCAIAIFVSVIKLILQGDTEDTTTGEAATSATSE